MWYAGDEDNDNDVTSGLEKPEDEFPDYPLEPLKEDDTLEDDEELPDDNDNDDELPPN